MSCRAVAVICVALCVTFVAGGYQLRKLQQVVRSRSTSRFDLSNLRTVGRRRKTCITILPVEVSGCSINLRTFVRGGSLVTLDRRVDFCIFLKI